jgi:outer membrane protein assembly factor BamB
VRNRALCLTFALSLPLAVAAEDAGSYWPQWRGPDASGSAPEANPPIRWSESENVLWKKAIPGLGSGTPVVWGDSLYVTTAVGQAAQQTRDDGRPGMREPSGTQRFVVLALDAATGETIWEKTVREQPPIETTHPDGTWASASAVTDGEHLFAFFGSYGLYCLTLDGALVWEKDLGDMQTRNGFGEGSTPALYGDSLVVQWDEEGPSFAAAFDKNTGEERWRRDRDERTSWATPLVIDVGGRAQAITSATNLVRAYDLESGELVWQVEGMTVNAIPSPVHSGGRLFVTSGFRGNALLAIDLAKAKGDITGSEAVAWSLDRDTPYVPSPLLYEDTLYFVKSNSGIISAVHAGTGETRFGPERLDVANVYASPIGAAGRVYVVGRDGDAAVLRHGDTLEVLAVNRLDDGFDASPVAVGRTLYLRGRSHLYALQEESAE